MRDLSEVGTAARLRLVADEHGLKRDLGTFQIADPERGRVFTAIRWRRAADGRTFDSGVPELMPSPMRESVRALLVSWFSGECPCCGELERPFEDAELPPIGDADMTRVQLNPINSGETGIEHLDECPLRPLAQMSRVVNTVGTEAAGAPLN